MLASGFQVFLPIRVFHVVEQKWLKNSFQLLLCPCSDNELEKENTVNIFLLSHFNSTQVTCYEKKNGKSKFLFCTLIFVLESIDWSNKNLLPSNKELHLKVKNMFFSSWCANPNAGWVSTQEGDVENNPTVNDQNWKEMKSAFAFSVDRRIRNSWYAGLPVKRVFNLSSPQSNRIFRVLFIKKGPESYQLE